MQETTIRELIERYEADRGGIGRFYNIGISPNRAERFKKLYDATRAELGKVAFESLNIDGKVDWILFDNQLRYNQRRLELDEKERTEAFGFLPFAVSVIELSERRQKMEKVDGERSAVVLDSIRDGIADKTKALEKELADMKTISAAVVPHRPFEYEFLDTKYDAMYAS